MSDSRELATREQMSPVVKRAADALKAFQSFKGLRFGSELDFHTPPVFTTEVTQLAPLRPDAYHDIPGGGLMPKKPLTNAIGDAVGVVFTENCGTRKGPGRYEVIGWAQGRKRLPDGTWKTSKVCEYSFDPEVRSELDFNSDKRKEIGKQKYSAGLDQEKHVLEYRKFATQRASTGAALMVIRDLANIPTAFKPEEIRQPMMFTRIALNTDELLRDPRARGEVVRMAIGATREIFGPDAERNVTPPREELPAPAAASDADDFDEPPPVQEKPPFAEPEETPLTVARKELAALVENRAVRDRLAAWPSKSGRMALDVANEVLSDENATLETLVLWRERAKRVGGVA